MSLVVGCWLLAVGYCWLLLLVLYWWWCWCCVGVGVFFFPLGGRRVCVLYLFFLEWGGFFWNGVFIASPPPYHSDSYQMF